MTRDEWIKRYAARVIARGSWKTQDEAVARAEGAADAIEEAGLADPDRWEAPEQIAEEDLSSERGTGLAEGDNPLTPFSTDEQQWYVADGLGGVGAGPFDSATEARAWIARHQSSAPDGC